MTHNDFILKYLSNTVDYDGKFGYQCTDLAKAYAKEVLGINPWAFGWSAKNASQTTFPWLKMIKYVAWVTAQTGDILIQDAYAGNIYGHVGIIHKAGRFGYYLLEQNAQDGSWSWLGNNATRVNYYTRQSKKVIALYRK